MADESQEESAVERDELAHVEIEAIKAAHKECKTERDRRYGELQTQMDRRFAAVEGDVEELKKSIRELRISIEGDGNGRTGLKGAIADLRADLRVERLKTTAIVAGVVILVQIVGPALLHWLERVP